MQKNLPPALGLLALMLTLAPCTVRAGVTLRVEGVKDPLKQAVTSAVALSQYAKRDASDAQVRRL